MITKLPPFGTALCLLALALILAFALPHVVYAAGLSQGESPPPLTVPDVAVVALMVFLGYYVNEGLKYILFKFGVNFVGKGPMITQFLVTSVILFLNTKLAGVTPPFQPFVKEAIMLLLYLFVPFGMKRQELQFMAAQLGLMGANQLLERHPAE